MTVAAKLQSAPSRMREPSHRSSFDRANNAAVTRDFAILVGVCLATGLATGLGMMLAVLVLA